MIFGYDVGMGAAKLAGRDGTVVMPAHVAVYDRTREVVDGLALDGETGPNKPLQVTVNNRTYLVGQGASHWGSTLDARDLNRLTDTPEARATFYAALSRYAQKHGLPAEIQIMLGLPFDALAGDGGAARKAAIERWVLGQHEWSIGGRRTARYSVKVTNVQSTRQAKGAIFAYCFDNTGARLKGLLDEVRKNEIGVISIGFRTVELDIFENAVPLPRRAGNGDNGVHELLERAIGDQRRYFQLAELDDRLRNGLLSIDDDTLQVWFNSLRGLIEATWGEHGHRLHRVILVGGGTYHARKLVEQLFPGRVYVPENPVTAIALGLRAAGLQLKGFGSDPAAVTVVEPTVETVAAEAAPAE